MRIGWRWVAVALVACLAGCGAGSGDSGPEPSSATPPVSLSGVGEIVWTATVDPQTHVPTEQLTTLQSDASQVIAALPVATLPAGTVLQARWSIDGDPLPALDPAPITVEKGRAGAWVTWTLRWEGDRPWPVGRLGIVVEIDGREAQRSDIPIVLPND